MSRVALAVAGVPFLLHPVLRPWDDETTAAGAHDAMASGAWVVSHLFAMIGFVLVGLALLGLRDLVGTTPVAVMWAGAGLIALAVGAVLVGLAFRRPSAWVFAAGFVLFLPQFFTPAPVRIAHGVLMLVGLVRLAADLKATTKVPSTA